MTGTKGRCDYTHGMSAAMGERELRRGSVLRLLAGGLSLVRALERRPGGWGSRSLLLPVGGEPFRRETQGRSSLSGREACSGGPL